MIDLKCDFLPNFAMRSLSTILTVFCCILSYNFLAGHIFVEFIFVPLFYPPLEHCINNYSVRPSTLDFWVVQLLIY